MLETTVALLFGLLIGSFLNVCVYRMPRDLSVIRPRSYCPMCERPIAWFDNIPLVSYALLAGKCRHCRARISIRYPLVELMTGALFALTVARLGVGVATLKWCLFEALMLGLLFSDLEQRILPDEFTLGGAAAGIAIALVAPMQPGYIHLFFYGRLGERWLSAGESVVGAVLGSGLLWLIGRLYSAVRHKEGLGLGDVKMLAMLGAFLGLPGALQTLVLGSIVGSLIGVVYMKITRQDFKTYELPFGTFLALAGLALGLLQGPLAG